MATSGDLTRIGGGTSKYEAYLENKRAVLRRSLKAEYLRQSHHPTMDASEIFDTAMYRWNAMQATEGKFIHRTLKTNTMFFFGVIFPAYLFYKLTSTHHGDFENRCRTGQLAYDSQERKQKWFM